MNLEPKKPREKPPKVKKMKKKSSMTTNSWVTLMELWMLIGKYKLSRS